MFSSGERLPAAGPLVATFTFGVGWLMVMASLNAAAHAAISDEVRARGMSVYVMSGHGGQLLGGLLSGAAATQSGASNASAFAAGTLVVGAVVLFLRSPAVPEAKYRRSVMAARVPRRESSICGDDMTEPRPAWTCAARPHGMPSYRVRNHPIVGRHYEWVDAALWRRDKMLAFAPRNAAGRHVSRVGCRLSAPRARQRGRACHADNLVQRRGRSSISVTSATRFRRPWWRCRLGTTRAVGGSAGLLAGKRHATVTRLQHHGSSVPHAPAPPDGHRQNLRDPPLPGWQSTPTPVGRRAGPVRAKGRGQCHRRDSAEYPHRCRQTGGVAAAT